jgi:hypothetical protein
MAWRISGTYLAACNCNPLCPCPVDGPPSSEDGQCRGVGVFHVADGNLDDVDLSGVTAALINHFPSNLTSGGWKLGIMVDDSASAEQASAIERIFAGQEGGPFADFAALTEEWLGMERGSVSFSDGDRPTGSVTGVDYGFEPLAGPEGSGTQTTVRNAAFGFAEEYRVGKSSGHFDNLGIEFDANYGETADYEFSSEAAEGAPTGRG